MNKVIKSKIDKNGLTGDSGFVSPNLHLAMNFSSNGMVFVDFFHENEFHGWKRVSLQEAIDGKMNIITCSQCDKPCVSIDHHYPYFSCKNHCEEHKPMDCKKCGGC